MQLKTFTGETSQEALLKVKAALGDNAIIVSTKEIKKKTLTSTGLYEIVVAIEDNFPQKAVPKKEKTREEEVYLKLSEAAKEIREIPLDEEAEERFRKKKPSRFSLPSSEEKLTKRLEEVKCSNDKEDVKEIKKEIAQLTDAIKLMQSTVWDMSKDTRNNLVIPPEFSEIYSIAKGSGIYKTHLDEIMKLTLKHMPLKMRKNSLTIKRYFNTLLRKMIPTRIERPVTSPSKKIMMFVGPTGVGKTTTIAKLAARYAYKLDRRYKVGIITLDTYRIGAVEQLMRYANTMKLYIETVVDPEDFPAALKSLKHNDYILIDTVGSSQHDKEKIDKLNHFLQMETHLQIDVNLVLSATTKYEDLKDIYSNFSILPIDTMVFTKLDETKGYGNVFSILYDTKKPISYFSVGQEVPDDIKIASSDFLINALLDEEKEVH